MESTDMLSEMCVGVCEPLLDLLLNLMCIAFFAPLFSFDAHDMVPAKG
jgi:hypothetical protein